MPLARADIFWLLKFIGFLTVVALVAWFVVDDTRREHRERWRKDVASYHRWYDDCEAADGHVIKLDRYAKCLISGRVIDRRHIPADSP